MPEYESFRTRDKTESYETVRLFFALFLLCFIVRARDVLIIPSAQQIIRGNVKKIRNHAQGIQVGLRLPRFQVGNFSLRRPEFFCEL